MVDNNKESFKQKAKGAKDKVVGGTKDAFGKATDNKKKQAEGKAQKLKGKGHDTVGNALEDDEKESTDR